MPKLHTVIIQSENFSRSAEALRTAVGLTLQGDSVQVIFIGKGVLSLQSIHDKSFQTPIEWLSRLGHEIYAEMPNPPHDEIDTIKTDEIIEQIAQGQTSASW